MINNPSDRSQFSKNIERILAKFDQEYLSSQKEGGNNYLEWSWDDHKDTIYSHNDSRFHNIIHIFHKEWHGIRAAAGSLPGRKLAIPEATLSDARLNLLALDIQDKNYLRIVFHGFSHNMGGLIRRFHDAGMVEKLFLVFHGSPAQWWNEVERQFAFEAIELAREGFIRRIHIMKNGMELPGVPLYKPLLYNLSPNHGAFLGEVSLSNEVSAFIPGWGNWIKNVFGTAYGASLSEKVVEVWVFASGLQLPKPLNNKLIRLQPSNREDTFKRYLSSHVTLNVSLIDCHPMVNVESQSFGRPCIRSDLNLDCYEDHEYVKIVSVGHNNSPTNIRSAVDRTLSVPQRELRELVLDYQGKVDVLAIDRYLEFLEL